MNQFRSDMIRKYGFPEFDYQLKVKNTPCRTLGVNDSEFIVAPNQNTGETIKHPAYVSWHAMLERCQRPYQIKKPTYIGVYCCEDWLSFSNFAIWFKDNYIDGFKLDKDLIIRGNKVYSPDTCVFVPDCINSFLTTSGKVRGPYPQGVTKESSNNRYRSSISYNNTRKHLGYFDTQMEAHKAWQLAKINKAKELMEEFKIPQLQLAISRIEKDIEQNLCTETI